MTATFRVTWDDVPQVAGDFSDVFAAMEHGQSEYEGAAFHQREDLDMSWWLGRASLGSNRTRLWLYDGDRRTAVHIDPVPAREPINPFQVLVMPKEVT